MTEVRMTGHDRPLNRVRTTPGERVARLGRFPIFSGLRSETLTHLARMTVLRCWPAGATIFQRGDDGDHLLALTGGRVRLSLATAQGRELMLRHCGPGDILGEIAILDGQPRSADAVAVEPVNALVIRREGFLEVAQQHADLGLALARHLGSLLRDTNYQMESIALFDLRMRAVRFFLHALVQIHGEDIPAEATLRLTLNQWDLSAVLGASRPKINQVLQGLIAEGAFRREGDTIVCAVDHLRRIASAEETD